MPTRTKTKYKRKKKGPEILAAVLVAVGAVLCILFGILSILAEIIPSFTVENMLTFGTIVKVFPIKEILAIIFGIIIIVIEGFNKLNDYWSIIGVFILGIIAGTIGMLLIIIGALIAIIYKVSKE